MNAAPESIFMTNISGMKKLVLSSLLLAFVCSTSAQEKIKIADIIKEHELQKKNNEPFSVSNLYENKEKGEYQFDRWLWYWKQHTDQDGYLVPKIEALRTWENYRADQQRANYKTTADQSDWKAIGPMTQSNYWLGQAPLGVGRINTMAFHPNDPDIFIVGTAGGGAWYFDGSDWNILTKNLMSSAVSDIDIDPNDDDIIYICTGDKNSFPVSPAGNDYNSIGLIKSTDGGQSWFSTGYSKDPSDIARTNCLVINPDNSNSLTLATENAIYKSFDAGNSWTKATISIPSTWEVLYVPEVHYKPADSSILYSPVTVRDTVTRNVYVFFMRSTNGGRNWTLRYVVPDAARAAIAVTPSNPNLIKVIVAGLPAGPKGSGLEGIYHSANSGLTFTKVFDDNNCSTNILASKTDGNDCGGQGMYDICIAIDPNNTDHVIIGGVNSWESFDGGFSWTLKNQWAAQQLGVPMLHADHHFVGYHPQQPSVLFDCNDGGIAVLPNGAGAWTDISPGMNITQYYRIAAAGGAPYVLGGAQDNGTGMIDKNNGISTPTGSGDGMECQIDPIDPNIIYTSSQYGHILRINLKQGISHSSLNEISDNIPGGQPAGAWTTPFLFDPNDPNRLVAGYNVIYSSTDRGETWSTLSDTFSSNMNRLAMTSANSGTIYATAESGDEIYVTHDMGNTWGTLQHPYNEPSISDIAADARDHGRCYITFPGYGLNKTKVATHHNGVWTPMNENLPDLPVYCIKQDTTNGTLYIGTYTGIYYRTDSMTQWEEFSTNLPTVSVFDIDIDYVTGEIIAGTWGRGMWVSPKHEEQLSIPKGIPYALDVIEVYPNPSNGHFVVVDNDNYFKDKAVTVTLTDVTGKNVWNSSEQFNGYKLSFDVNNVATGNYILQLTGADGKTAKERVIIKH